MSEVEKSLTSPPCSDCGTFVTWKKPPKSVRLPSGWKRKGTAVYCSACWGKHYILRAVVIPVAAPETGTWDELRASLRSMWIATTQASNWILTELYARDTRRGDEEKMPPMKPVYLYPELRARFPALPSQTCAALEKAVTAKYRAKRYDVIWTCGASLPTHRYPTPFPVPSQGWSVVIDKDHAVVSLRIGDARIFVRLRAGHGFRRQMDSVRRIVSGDAEAGQMDIYPQSSNIMCKMVAWLPRTIPAPGAARTLHVRSAEDAIVVALNPEAGKLWAYHGDQIPRWAAEHRRRLQNWADDSKAEHRPVPPFQARRENAALKYRQRMKSAAHQIAALIVGYASRRKFAAIEWDDTVQTFAPDFPWSDLAAKIAMKADAAGIAFTVAVAKPT